MGRVIVSILGLALLAGCSERAPPPDARIFDGQRQALDKARDAGAKVQQSSERERSEIDAQSR